ncbi:hypothetical protein J2X55_002818 [Microbacterium sp. 1154]|uniref:hypothetical protein n=1 Tax=Microbacterium sp. 1154 TaxID=2817733 RepID=UPI000E23A95F|nr:hypothetical protein [Microbacterium sp. 1154]MDR6691888.1 hypothetical protein [Microbacterium sp. 1154]
MVSPFLFFPGERLAASELSAACLDGVLVPLGEGFMPADAAETSWMRARSLLPLLGDRWAGVRATAAWVHGGMPAEPARHHLQRVATTRSRAHNATRVVFHDVRLPTEDTVTLGGIHLSTPGRTLADLARSDDVQQRATALAWAASDSRVRRDAEAWLARHPTFPYGRRGTALLASVTSEGDRGGYDEVTRYTS